MCGILALVGSAEQETFIKALTSLKHRGPDGHGVWSESGIAMGHTRLSIIDLSNDARQPMLDHSGRYVISFNGEIYNYIEIKKELQQLGHRFISSSDTEVLLASFAQWGEKCLFKFNGMWSLLIWDRVTKKLFVSRDRFGKKPLFFAKTKFGYVFASEMKAIFPFLEQLKISNDFHWMARKVFDYESTSLCLIYGIERFPAGYFGWLEDDNLSKFRFWNTLDHLTEVPQKYEDQVEKFRELFLDSCKIRMRSDVPLGTALSGGLDSSATLSAINFINKGSGNNNAIQAFVACFPGSEIDEKKHAEMVVRHLGVPATYIEIDPIKHWNRIYSFLYDFEEIYLTPPLPMILTYEQVKKSGVSVTLDGHGADEMLTGYGHLIHSLWDSKASFNSISEVFSLINSSNPFSKDEDDHLRFMKYLSYMSRTTVKKALGRDVISKDSKHENFKRLDNFTKHLYVIFHETILPTLLRNYDRYSMINGVEIRMPFMDHRLVSYVFSLPSDSKNGKGYTKRIVRDAISPLLPHEIAWRKTKIGFNSPMREWMMGPLKEFFLDTISSTEFHNTDLIHDKEILKKRMHVLMSGNESSWSSAEKIWSDLSPFFWGQAILKRGAV